MNKQEVIKQLNELAAELGYDAEVAHEEADNILILFLQEQENELTEVAKAYLGAKKRIGFRYS